jgi:hypothetical protein
LHRLAGALRRPHAGKEKSYYNQANPISHARCSWENKNDDGELSIVREEGKEKSEVRSQNTEVNLATRGFYFCILASDF